MTRSMTSLDRTMLSLYDQLLAKTGSHSQAARLLRTDRVSQYISELNERNKQVWPHLPN